MVIEKITSIADLLFKAKTQEIYRRLLIEGVRENIYVGTRPTDTYEQCLAELDRYTTQVSSIGSTCSLLVQGFNHCVTRIAREEEEKENYRMYVLKNRERTPNRNGDVYFYNRPAEGNSENIQRTPMYTIEVRPGATHDTIRMTGISSDGEPIVSERTIPNNLSMNQRSEMEAEIHERLRQDIEIRRDARRVVRRMNSNIWSNFVGNSYGDPDPI